MKRITLLLSIMLCALYAAAQSTIVQELERTEPGKGTITIEQPAKLDSLMGRMSAKTTQVEGYRVMVYSGNNSRAARDEANNWAQYMREHFPGAEVYVVFESPIRSCQYGDYRTREEAEAVMYKLKATRKFKEISVRKTLINLPY
ncbi:MAG: SPOR domain-containing protein [Bacteroidaceae bacterium]|nr:SPOR domain-containing protein [Bacteroidaceae bacterium]